MPQPLRVLFIGDSGADGVEAELRNGGFEPSFERILTEAQLQTALAEAWDIAISEFTAGEFGAMAALRVIQERAIDLPLIVVSGKAKDADALLALQAGAADHLSLEPAASHQRNLALRRAEHDVTVSQTDPVRRKDKSRAVTGYFV